MKFYNQFLTRRVKLSRRELLVDGHHDCASNAMFHEIGEILGVERHFDDYFIHKHRFIYYAVLF